MDVLLDLCIAEKEISFATSFDTAIACADLEIQALAETVDSTKALKPDCDKLDYALSASSGALCGIIDVFLLGKPGESPIGDITDKWFEKKTIVFAKFCGWEPRKEATLQNAVAFLERKFRIPYDQRGVGDAGSIIFELCPGNHHFKSLAHNPSLLGLFFSIMDQWNNTSHFVSNGELISLEKADDEFLLKGHNVPSKLFCGLVNWIGHLISDRAGSSSSKGRGMGIPSPLWTWTNDVIAIKRTLNLDVNKFEKAANELAVKIYDEGYDSRFQTAQAIPVVINELFVRTLYAVRRLIGCFSESKQIQFSFPELWRRCEPFSNPTVKRMLTVSHGVFCLVDLGDATIRSFISGGGAFNPTEFLLRLNIVGIGRFTVALYDEGVRAIQYVQAERDAELARREIFILESYIDGLRILARSYDDVQLFALIDALRGSNAYTAVFQKTVELAVLRGVPEDKTLHSKAEIDDYFRRGN